MVIRDLFRGNGGRRSRATDMGDTFRTKTNGSRVNGVRAAQARTGLIGALDVGSSKIACIIGRAEAGGVARAALDPFAVFVLSLLAGAFIAFGAAFATTVGAGNVGPDALPYGVMRVLTGIVFCAGLIMVIIAGAELFTGNNMLVMAWASER